METKNKTKTQFTWNRKDKSEATRIDYFLVSTEILMNVYSSDIRPKISLLSPASII
jgi:exonuclease III